MFVLVEDLMEEARNAWDSFDYEYKRELPTFEKSLRVQILVQIAFVGISQVIFEDGSNFHLNEDNVLELITRIKKEGYEL